MTKVIFVFPRDSEVVDMPERDAIGVIVEDGEEQSAPWGGWPAQMVDAWRLHRQHERLEEEKDEARRKVRCPKCDSLMETSSSDEPGRVCRNEGCSSQHIVNPTCGFCHELMVESDESDTGWACKTCLGGTAPG